MTQWSKWCASSEEKVGGHRLQFLEADSKKLALGVAAVAQIVPSHYSSEERIAVLLRRLGKKKAAAFLESKLPTSKKIRSGDLGEILAATYLTEFMGFGQVVNRLRWKDHREMAMRGDDIIGARLDPVSGLELLKGEVKSASSLSTATIKKARKALKSSNGRPSPHALSFIADRLHEQGEHKLADAIDDAQLEKGIGAKQILHLMFALSGNDPRNILRTDLQSYGGRIAQLSVGVRVQGHQAFIASVYGKVIANGVVG